jgi:hypothetical protein
MHRLLSFCSNAVAGMLPVTYNRGIANAELEGEAPTALAAGIATEPALTAEDASDALGDGLAAPAARCHYERPAKKSVPRMGSMLMVEVTTTVAMGGDIHGCTSRTYVANAKILELLGADEATHLDSQQEEIAREKAV